MKKLRIVILGLARRDRKRSLNDGRIQNPSNSFGIVPLSNFVPRGFGFVHRSKTRFCRAVPNPNITIRNFCIARTAAAPAPRSRSTVESPPPATCSPLRWSERLNVTFWTTATWWVDCGSTAVKAAWSKRISTASSMARASGVPSRVHDASARNSHCARSDFAHLSAGRCVPQESCSQAALISPLQSTAVC